LHVVRPSVCDVDGSGPHRLEILETNCTDIHLLPGEHGEIWGRQEVRWEKVASWNTKAAISLKRVKIEDRSLSKAYRNSSTLFGTVPSPSGPSPYGLPFPKVGGSHPPPKTAIAISGKGKATNFKFCTHIHRIDRNQSPLKILEKKERGRIQRLPNLRNR